jgi:hypothetical protein
LSARDGSHITHAAPAAPHDVVDGGAQVVPVQQPLGQLAELQPVHAPPVHAPPLQSWHRAPPVPQLMPLVPARQVDPEQQPLGQDVWSHTHAPETQRWPAPHGGPPPHRHAPAAEQVSAPPAAHVVHAPPPTPHDSSDVVRQLLPVQHPAAHEMVSQMQAPATQRWPLTHAAPVPHAHVPAGVQPSATAPSQVAHATPPVPQRPRDGDVHAVPSQQPLGHEVALHAHLPPTQR